MASWMWSRRRSACSTRSMPVCRRCCALRPSERTRARAGEAESRMSPSSAMQREMAAARSGRGSIWRAASAIPGATSLTLASPVRRPAAPRMVPAMVRRSAASRRDSTRAASSRARMSRTAPTVRPGLISRASRASLTSLSSRRTVSGSVAGASRRICSRLSEKAACSATRARIAGSSRADSVRAEVDIPGMISAETASRPANQPPMMSASIQGSGFRGTLWTRISRCRWGPTERPVLPTRPTVCPTKTVPPVATSMAERCE